MTDYNALSRRVRDAVGADRERWQPIKDGSPPSEGYFMVWSPDFPDIPMTVKASIYHSARGRPGQPKHLSFDHWTHWMPCPPPPTEGQT